MRYHKKIIILSNNTLISAYSSVIDYSIYQMFKYDLYVQSRHKNFDTDVFLPLIFKV